MCVIVYKPQGVSITEEDLDLMWSKNSDGAGLAYFLPENHPEYPGYIQIEKGFMKLAALKARLIELGDITYTLHFRFATHGLKNEAGTHPFPITTNKEDLLSVTKVLTDACLFHNGILNYFGDKTISDTAEFVCEVLAHIPDFRARKALLQSIEGKYVYMHENTYTTFGFFETYKGLSCSNTWWAPRVFNAQTNFTSRNKQYWEETDWEGHYAKQNWQDNTVWCPTAYKKKNKKNKNNQKLTDELKIDPNIVTDDPVEVNNTINSCNPCMPGICMGLAKDEDLK